MKTEASGKLSFRSLLMRVAGFFVLAWRKMTQGLKRLLGRSPETHRPAADMDMSETQVFGDLAETPHARSARKPRLRHSVPSKYRSVPHISKEHLSGEGKEHINMFQPRRREGGVIIRVLLTSVRLVLIVLFMIAAAGAGVLVGVSKAYMETTPKLDTGKIEDQSETSYIYDSYGELIALYTGSENRDWANLDEIPKYLQEAVIAIEDIRFKYHSGVDIKRLVGAFINNLMNSNVQGGSTITQQLIKNRLLSTERTYKRKIQEAYLALQLEKEYSKDEILEAYLNTINLGASNYGVKAAAMDYFGKNLNDLTLRECAMLAGITRYPYLYSPRRCYYDAKNPKIINDRTDHVLYQMYKAGYISYEEYQQALHDTVYVQGKSRVNEMYQMPYFVEYAVYDVITHLLKQRNMQDNKQNRAQLENELRTNGYRIYTTVDPNVQKVVEQSLAEWDAYPKLEDADDSVIYYDHGDGTVTEVVQPQAAAVIIDQSSGDIKALVGGRTTPTARKTLNRAYQTTMPVGSSIKPLAVYGPALDKGYSDGTVVPNLPLPIPGWLDDSGKETYPSGGSSSYGPVTLRSGLVRSLNAATAWTLMELVGLDDSYNYLVDMGVNPAHINKSGAGLALGTSGITPVEMAGAFAAITNAGVYHEPLSFTLVTDRDGNVILDAKEIRDSRQVFKPSTAWLLADMLVEAVSSRSGTGRNARIEGITVGGKTGTNQNARGIYFVGFTPYYTMSLWIGHDDYKPLAGNVYASSSAAPLWQYIMAQLVKDKPNAPIIDASPEELGLTKVRVCSVSGKKATEACETDSAHKPVAAWYPSDSASALESCDWHQTFPTCKESGKIATHYCPNEQIEMRSLLMLPDDSIYWKLTDAQLQKYLPGAQHALPGGLTLADIDPSMPEYAGYFCNIHTLEWYEQQEALRSAINAANDQLRISNAVLTDPQYAMSLDDKQQLLDKINELTNLISNPSATAAAIEQVTEELRQLTVRLVSTYSGIETDNP